MSTKAARPMRLYMAKSTAVHLWHSYITTALFCERNLHAACPPQEEQFEHLGKVAKMPAAYEAFLLEVLRRRRHHQVQDERFYFGEELEYIVWSVLHSAVTFFLSSVFTMRRSFRNAARDGTEIFSRLSAHIILSVRRSRPTMVVLGDEIRNKNQHAEALPAYPRQWSLLLL